MECFYDVHGQNLQLRSEKQVATRINSFDCGLCALNSRLIDASSLAAGNPETTSQIFQLQVTNTNSKWKGGLAIGLSPQQPIPGELPESSMSAGEGWEFIQLPQEILSIGTIISIWFDFSTRELCYEILNKNNGDVNEEDEDTSGELQLSDQVILASLDDNPKLWLYLDVYGFVTEVKIIG